MSFGGMLLMTKRHSDTALGRGRHLSKPDWRYNPSVLSLQSRFDWVFFANSGLISLATENQAPELFRGSICTITGAAAR
jgi:hypothetical protein